MTQCIICGSNVSKIKRLVDSFKIVQCSQCGLEYLQNPLPAENDLKTYENYFQNSPISAYHPETTSLAMKTLWQLNDQRIQWIKTMKPKGSLLDIGSGRGYFLYHASLSGYRVEGIEISSSAADYCEQHFGITTHRQDITTEGDHLAHYDVITLWHVLEHLTNPLIVLQSLKSKLAADGVLFIEVPNIHSLKFVLAPKSKKWIGGNHPRHHRFFFSAKTLTLVLQKAGFTDIKMMRSAYQLSRHPKIQSLIKQGLKFLNLDSFINVCAR